MRTNIQLHQDIQRELMVRMIVDLRHGKLSASKAQALAADYLVLKNISTAEELFAKIFALAEKYSQMLEVYLKCATEYFEQKTEELLTQARQHLNVGQYEHALLALKGESYGQI